MTIHVPGDVHEQMEREVSRRNTTRSGLWVEGARAVLEAGTQRSEFYERARRATETDSFRRYQEQSLAADDEYRADHPHPSIDDDFALTGTSTSRGACRSDSTE